MSNKINIHSNKKDLRKAFLNARNQHNHDKIHQSTELIWHRLKTTTEYKKSKIVFIYINYDFELHTQWIIDQMIKDDKTIVIPKCGVNHTLVISPYDPTKNILVENQYGILELSDDDIINFDNHTIDLIIMPGIAFSTKGERLGYGGGYYDRFIASFKTPPSMIGLCEDDFLVSSLPSSDHDVTVPLIITEKRMIRL